ncbi:DUF1656 domain-containing protein [Shewanella psychrophila]|uniref:DUF1656 domain-containing protein n=1 Tax=Shewanella psychrophila TaxID=225848 RepID=UPI0011EA5740
MKDVIFFDSYYLPAFLNVFILSIGIWLLSRNLYSPILTKLKVWHPSLCDCCFFTITLYLVLTFYMV